MEPRRAKHIGIIACSSESAAHCYRTLCLEAGSALGEHFHPEVSLHNHPLGDYLRYVREEDWEGTAQLLSSSALKLARAGAKLLICPDIAVHPAFSILGSRSDIPCLHIAAEVVREAQIRDYRRLAILGTRAWMESPLCADALALADLEYCTASRDERIEIDAIINRELAHGKLTARSRQRMHEVIARLVTEQQCDALVLGGTELSLLVAWDRAPVAVLDATTLLARAALRVALE